jgi:hypothetical protein
MKTSEMHCNFTQNCSSKSSVAEIAMLIRHRFYQDLLINLVTQSIYLIHEVDRLFPDWIRACFVPHLTSSLKVQQFMNKKGMKRTV